MTAPEALQRGDCTIAWEEGPGGGRAGVAIALLHGFGMSRDAMRPLAKELVARRIAERVLLADARGHGDTQVPERDEAHAYPAMRDDLTLLLERTAPDGAHLVGHSMGGQIALMAAIARPDLVRSLCLLAAGPCRAVTHQKERRSWERAAAAFEGASRKELARSLAMAAPTRDSKLSPDRLYGAARGDSLARVVRGGFLTVESNDADCASLRTPTLLIAGADDEGWREPTRKLAGLVQGAALQLLENAGHLVHLEHPRTCADRIAAFIASIE
jgi:pimeloyl-ACP methyl ester carboxylesterase